MVNVLVIKGIYNSLQEASDAIIDIYNVLSEDGVVEVLNAVGEKLRLSGKKVEAMTLSVFTDEVALYIYTTGWKIVIFTEELTTEGKTKYAINFEVEDYQ